MQNNVAKKFLEKGYVIISLNNKEIKYLNEIKKKILLLTKKKLNIKNSNENLFENLHKHISNKKINKFRINIFNQMNTNSFNDSYFKLCKNYLNEIVGNEIAGQKKINLSIQMPNDISSILPIHSDTWAGDSPYEVVVWVPLTRAYKTNSMYIIPYDRFMKKKFNKIVFKNNIEIYKKFQKDLDFVKLKYGQILIFNQNLPHGNQKNLTKITRWSFNCRYKSLFSPYNQKKFLEFFITKSIKPASIFGINYEEPNFK